MHPADGVALTLVAYNNLANLVPGFQRWYVQVNLVATALLLCVARAAGLELREVLGARAGEPLVGEALRGVGIGALAGAPLALAFGVAAALPGSRAHVADQRMVADPELGRLTLRELAGRTLVRIPLGTALAEEVAFRGVLYALEARRASPLRAALRSNVAFGLWHVLPTRHAVAANRPTWHASPRSTALAIAGGVATTFAGGLLLSRMREVGGLTAAVTAHAVTNAGAALAGWAALGEPGPPSGRWT